MLHTSEVAKPTGDLGHAAPVGWRNEFSWANPASVAARIAFPIAAFATLLPFVSPGIALMLGICIALSLGNAYIFTTARLIPPLLQVSVIGLGAGMNLSAVGRAGVHGFFYTVIGITLTMSIGLTLGQMIRTDRDTSLLVTVGTAICGGSAIAAVAPAIHAKSHDVSVALATVFFLNAVALFIFSWIGHHFGLSQMQFGVWSALAIHDTSSVVGAAMQYGAQALEIATTIKLTRALWIVPCDRHAVESRKRTGGRRKGHAAVVYPGISRRCSVGDVGPIAETRWPYGVRRRPAFVGGHIVSDRLWTEPQRPSDSWPATPNPGLCALGADGQRNSCRDPVRLDRLVGRKARKVMIDN